MPRMRAQNVEARRRMHHLHILRLECLRVMYDIKELRARRRQIGLAQWEVAEELGFTLSTICSWETEQTRPHENHLKMYDYMLRRYEKKGIKLRRVRYDGGANDRRVRILSPGEVKSLASKIERLGITLKEGAGMLGVYLCLYQTKLRGKRKMTAKDERMFMDLIYEFEKEGRRIPDQRVMKRARILLKYYLNYQSRWHILLYKIKHLAGSLSAQNYGASHPSEGSYSDPVSRRYQALEKLRSASNYALNDALPVMEEYLALKNSSLEEEREMFLVLERFYGEKESIEDIAASTGKSTRTLYRRKYELVCRVARRLEGEE